MRMQHNLKQGLLLLFLMGLMHTISAGGKGNNEANWCLAREKNDVALFYRWIELRNGDRTREMKAEFTINAELSDILEQFSTSENYLKWAVGIKKCNIEKQNDSLWYTHSVMSYPWPFRKKDLITKHFVKQNHKTTSIFIEAAPEFRAEVNGVERMKNYRGTWNFTPIGNGTTSVDYRVISYEKPALPRVVQDPVIQRISINSFAELRNIAEKK